MSEKQNGDNSDAAFRVLLLQWAVRTSSVSFGLVITILIGVWLDRLFGTVALFAIIGVIVGMALAFWQLIRFAYSGIDKPPDLGDNTSA